MKKTANKGFTLIELLVVIAIIGILAGIILVSLNGARNKAKDAAIKAEISALRAQGEIYADDNGASYANFCSADAEVARVSTKITADGSTLVCESDDTSGSAWAANAQLISPTTDAWFCVDSAGNSTTTSSDTVTGTTDWDCD